METNDKEKEMAAAATARSQADDLAAMPLTNDGLKKFRDILVQELRENANLHERIAELLGAIGGNCGFHAVEVESTTDAH